MAGQLYSSVSSVFCESSAEDESEVQERKKYGLDTQDVIRTL